MKILTTLKKNNFIFFILKNIQRLLKKMIKKVINFSDIEYRVTKIENVLISEFNNKFFDWENNCLNGQKYRKKIIDNILTNIEFDIVIETGTEYGFTTKFFSNYSKKIVSIEKSKTNFLLAKRNLQNEENIQLILNDSKNIGKILEDEKISISKDNSIFFYLDAHSDDDYPLLDEIKYIFEKYQNYIILIDDFQVPNDENYGYDSFKGKKLNIEFIKKLFSGDEYIFFPKISGKKETGRIRGYSIITKNSDYAQILKSINELITYNS